MASFAWQVLSKMMILKLSEYKLKILIPITLDSRNLMPLNL